MSRIERKKGEKGGGASLLQSREVGSTGGIDGCLIDQGMIY